MTTIAIDPPDTMPQLSHSDRLCAKIQLASPAALQVSNEILNHPRLKEIYPEFLIRGWPRLAFRLPGSRSDKRFWSRVDAPHKPPSAPPPR